MQIRGNCRLLAEIPSDSGANESINTIGPSPEGWQKFGELGVLVGMSPKESIMLEGAGSPRTRHQYSEAWGGGAGYRTQLLHS